MDAFVSIVVRWLDEDMKEGVNDTLLPLSGIPQDRDDRAALLAAYLLANERGSGGHITSVDA